MMQFENAMTFVRAVKGAPASVLLAFIFVRRAMTSLELQQWTGYKDDNITLATRLLVELGWLIARSPRGPWCLADGRQLPLMADSDLIGISPTTTTIEESNRLIKRSVVVRADPKPIKSELRQYLEEIGVPVEANLKACKIYGIGEPMATRLAEMKHVTPDFIEAHIRSLVDGETKGLAIVRIRGDEMPRLWMEEIDRVDLASFHEEKAARKRGLTADEYRASMNDESEDE